MISLGVHGISPTFTRVLEGMSSADFQLWLNQRIWINNNTKVLRREYIPIFAESLTNYMKQLGFSMVPEWGKGHRCVARWMYILMRGKDARYPDPFHRNALEDLDEFHYIFTIEASEKFFESWRLCEDFDVSTRIGQRYLHELQDLLYAYVDMDKRMMELEDTDSDAESWRSTRHDRVKGDVYLEEAQEGFHGGKGYKV